LSLADHRDWVEKSNLWRVKYIYPAKQMLECLSMTQKYG